VQRVEGTNVECTNPLGSRRQGIDLPGELDFELNFQILPQNKFHELEELFEAQTSCQT
jgi:hypothetical protein